MSGGPHTYYFNFYLLQMHNLLLLFFLFYFTEGLIFLFNCFKLV